MTLTTSASAVLTVQACSVSYLGQGGLESDAVTAAQMWGRVLATERAQAVLL